MNKRKLSFDKKTALTSLAYPLFSLALILALWAATAAYVGSDLLLPSIGETFSQAGVLLADKKTYVNIAATLLRAIRGFVISFAVALGLAVASAFFKTLAKILSPIQTTPVLVTVLIIFPLLYTSFYTAVTGVDKKLVDMAKVYKVPFVTRLMKLYIPSALPEVFSAVRSTLSLTVKLTIAAEVLAQTRNSIGVDMQIANLYLETPTLIAWTIIAIVLGALLELAVFGLGKLCMRWKNA